MQTNTHTKKSFLQKSIPILLGYLKIQDFKLASGIMTLLALAVLFTYSVKNGIILLVIAVLVSPMGLPLLAVKLLSGLKSINDSLKGFIHS